MPMLQSIGENIWFVDGDNVRFLGMNFPTRAIITKLSSGMLWVWSPIQLTDELHREVAAIGEVGFLVSPNSQHHLFLSQWLDAFPNAMICGPQMTAKKRADLDFHHILTRDAPAEWSAEICQVHFAGSPLFEEIGFFHKRSGSLILADMIINLPQNYLAAHWPGWRTPFAKFLGITEKAPCAPLEARLSFFRHNALRLAVAQMLEWQPNQLLLAHGNHIQSNCSAQLKRSFSWVRGA